MNDNVGLGRLDSFIEPIIVKHIAQNRARLKLRAAAARSFAGTLGQL